MTDGLLRQAGYLPQGSLDLRQHELAQTFSGTFDATECTKLELGAENPYH